MKKWTGKFADPEAEYRPHPFWSWNDELEEEELRRQVRDMAEHGLGGFFMHARDGLTTPYMGEKWFRMIRACMEEAEKQGMNPWCYDEMGWPSGSGGGTVPNLHKDYRTSWIHLHEYTGEIKGDLIAFYAVKNDTTYRMIKPSENDPASLLSDGERLMYASRYTRDDYIDVLNPDAVKAFIESTYDKYKETTGGKSLRGFFTDEPQFALCKTTWPAFAEEEFRKAYGYSITENIPALFLGRDGNEKVRYDYWKMINRLYTESFAKQIYEWCEKNGCKLTGHAMMEDNMLCQIHCTAGCMPMYEYMHIPGIDWLGRALQGDCLTGETGSLITPLQLGSVAAQLGKKQTLSETYAMTGWDVSFAEMKQLAEWQFIGGVNLLCQHLEGYTIRGRRKNDFPPSIFYQSPWWKEYKLFSDTVSRLGKMLSEGIDDPGTLLIHPMHSIWLKYTNDDLCAEEDFDYRFSRTAQILSDSHVLYHLGDETILARHGSVDGKTLKVGKCTYRTVVLPDLFGLDRSTYELLLQFAKNGGRLVRMGDVPTFIDGRPAEEEIKKLYEKCEYINTYPDTDGICAVDRYFTDAGEKSVHVVGKGAKHIRFCKREYPEDGKTAYFFLNLDRKNSHSVKIRLNEKDALEFHYDTMDITAPSCKHQDGILEISAEFPPMASHLFIAGDTDEVYAPSERKDLEDVDLSGGTWRLGEGSDVNCYTMEYCSVGDGVEWRENIHIHKADGAVDNLRQEGKDALVRFTFNVSADADLDALKEVRAVCELQEPVILKINGAEVSRLDGEWWLDRSFGVYEVGAHLRHGENVIELSDFFNGDKERSVEVGYLYLTGSFGVFSLDDFTDNGGTCLMTENRFVIGNRPTVFENGNIVTNGHPFFAGRIVLERDVDITDAEKPRRVTVRHMGAALARVHVNGVEGKILPWEDFSDDVTSRIKEGANTIGIELVIGNRNLLGPWHKTDPEKCNATPENFETWDKKRWRDGYSFLKCGVDY